MTNKYSLLQEYALSPIIYEKVIKKNCWNIDLNLIQDKERSVIVAVMNIQYLFSYTENFL